MSTLGLEKISFVSKLSGNVKKSSFAIFVNTKGLNTYVLNLIRFLVKRYEFLFTITKNNFIKKVFKAVFNKKVCFNNQNNALILGKGSYRTYSFIKNLKLIFEKKKLNKSCLNFFEFSENLTVISKVSINTPLIQFRKVLLVFINNFIFITKRFLTLLNKNTANLFNLLRLKSI
ncbi:MAG: 50S ribosomal protein L10 [Candidatus Organicella extenuata]|jgi:hypothetical protein|uniref:Large ribosomal subunit protein uL10 n=1 Tax=Candidatus Organicella extenuata TaxID=2841811 RepID=A0AA51BL53_9BACT|nr:MAG: 50S ribosomal protein L10 [Candidatus Organicella extenuata]